VLLYVVGLFTILLGWLLMRWALGRFAPVSIGVTLVVLLVAGFIEVRWDLAERDFTHVTQKLIHRKDVHVQCQRLTGTLIDASGTEGHVMYHVDGSLPNLAHLTWSTCHNLAAWRRGGHKSSAAIKQIIAVHVLTHEAMHLTGITDEATAECDALQHDSEAAQLLGASKAVGDALARRYWQEVYPYMSDGYRSSECHAGGAMDLHPDTPDWPTG